MQTNSATTSPLTASESWCEPTQLIGPRYSAQDAAEYRRTIARDGAAFRRVVLPLPYASSRRRWYAPCWRAGTSSSASAVVACRYGPTAKGRQTGLQAVVDKNLASAALAAELKADMLVMLTGGDFVSENWGTAEQRDIRTASPEAISRPAFAEGSMKPKVDAAVRVARAGGRALIGPLERLDDLLGRSVGTQIRPDVPDEIV
ncbi:hypothetical protein ACFQ2K_11630 [Streptomyces sanglieri]|uniref:Aspartate/glutamate/uridylate kinase domain-containing protein n=1 Tax=Streptomyces sanglieri TaxID=193460 RepID=A0ABW2WSN1_9ACTN